MQQLTSKISFFSILLLLFVGSACAQEIPADKPKVLNPDFDQKISSLLNFKVPLIGVEALKENKEDYILLDAREEEEYNVSHIEGARYIGYNKLNIKELNIIPKDKKIVLYCSIGYRSEKIGERLQKMGYSQVFNLYGSIFEWANQGNLVVDQNGSPTKYVHGYNKSWSKWLDDSKVKKTW